MKSYRASFIQPFEPAVLVLIAGLAFTLFLQDIDAIVLTAGILLGIGLTQYYVWNSGSKTIGILGSLFCIKYLGILFKVYNLPGETILLTIGLLSLTVFMVYNVLHVWKHTGTIKAARYLFTGAGVVEVFHCLANVFHWPNPTLQIWVLELLLLFAGLWNLRDHQQSRLFMHANKPIIFHLIIVLLFSLALGKGS